jgi:serine/threonine-protein kinase RsbW
MEKKFPRELASLEKVFVFIREFVAASQIDSSVAFSVDLAVEEIFTNMVRHNSGGAGDIAISLDRHDNKLVICVTDHDVDAFEVKVPSRADVDLPPAERTPGGLGLYLVNQVMDKVSFEYEDRNSRVTMTKHLEI